MKKARTSYLIFFLIFLLAVVLRFTGLNWDAGFHLHPDERFLSIVANASRMPSSIFQYLDPSSSPLNPTNVGYDFFVYGAFPLIVNKVVAVMFGNDSYGLFHLQGRMLSAFADLITLLFVYKIAQVGENKFGFSTKIKYFAAFFYAIAVLPIQLSHFFTVDSFVNCFCIASLYFSVKLEPKKKTRTSLIASAIFFGLAIATKATAVFMLPLILFFLLSSSHKKWKAFFVFGIVSYLSLRIADPYIFQSANVLDPRINAQFIKSIISLKALDRPDVWFPPGVQWIHKIPIIYSLTNLAIFGIGIPYFILALTGIGKAIMSYSNRLKIFLLWGALFFIYQSIQYSQPMRYFILLYPLIAILSAVGLEQILHLISSLFHKRHVPYAIVALILFIVLIWPISFMSIYMHPHSRVVASEWIYKNIPDHAILLAEHWDDGLPLLLPSQTKKFTTYQLPIFDPDTQTKWATISASLDQADYYILSSNRGWGSIPTVPERYPMMTKFYNDLFAGRTNYLLVKEFTSYPTFAFLGFRYEVNDQSADESFTVYDHPKVMIFKRVQ